jgi:hypothetical protein
MASVEPQERVHATLGVGSARLFAEMLNSSLSGSIMAEEQGVELFKIIHLNEKGA